VIDTGSANRCITYATVFVVLGIVTTLRGIPWVAALAFGLAADAVRRVPTMPDEDRA
jgi:hypothetical protein